MAITNHNGKAVFEQLRLEDKFVISVLRNAIESELDKIDAAAYSMSSAPWIAPPLKNGTGENIEKANSVLDRYCKSFKASVIYLLDTDGKVIASSNRATSESFVGKNYSFKVCNILTTIPQEMPMILYIYITFINKTTLQMNGVLRK